MRHARLAGRVDQAVELTQPGRWFAWFDLIGLSQNPEDAAQLAQRVLARRLDRPQRLGGVLGALMQHMSGDPGLHVDRRDAVCEHVVELARDPQSLGVDLATCLLLARPLSLRRPTPRSRRYTPGGC